MDIFHGIVHREHFLAQSSRHSDCIPLQHTYGGGGFRIRLNLRLVSLTWCLSGLESSCFRAVASKC